ncbi:MAG TPA: MarR family winged helix-turn-helix transcriptional regulator [Polyangia bacterium]|jgi:DNA-binding MarR family transcriptional regulator|nr:MarR family winged helix-turn-helix transcriptional regulator [Polyangia bacterium]
MAEEARFGELLSQVARAITRRQASDVCCGDLTLEQFQTLRAVSGADQPSLGSLSASLRLDPSTMSRNVALLERNGYLQRARSAEDGRVVRVRLTAKGKRALESLRCDERDVFGDAYQRLPVAERAKVVQALEALSSCLEVSDDRARACCPPVAIRRRVA